MKMLKKFLLLVSLMLGVQSQPALADGIDLNPALLGCILSGGSCLVHTGVDLIDSLFGEVTVNQDHHNTYQYRKHYFHTGRYWDMFGKSDCRKAKQDFYIKKTGWTTTYAAVDFERKRYLQQYEYYNGKHIFDCTSEQRQIFIKAMIGKE